MASDLVRYRKVLDPVAKAAREQSWYKERPWRTKTHVVEEHGAVVVDLHDLRAALAKKAVHAVVEAGVPKAGAVVFVHGRGQHSLVPGGVLQGVVTEALGKACLKHSGWAVRRGRPGRTVWVTDRKRAPKAHLGGGGIGLSLGIVLFVCLFFAAVLFRLGVLPLDLSP
ncbi:MAG: hypothetical protein AAGA48_11935 [Myxococcota bacterium]